jgi:hypothetical protein
MLSVAKASDVSGKRVVCGRISFGCDDFRHFGSQMSTTHRNEDTMHGRDGDVR